MWDPPSPWPKTSALKTAPHMDSEHLTKMYDNVGKLSHIWQVLFNNRKSHTDFRLVPKVVTLNDLEQRNGTNGSYFVLFHRIRQIRGKFLMSKRLKLGPYCLRQKCMPNNLAFGNI